MSVVHSTATSASELIYLFRLAEDFPIAPPSEASLPLPGPRSTRRLRLGCATIVLPIARPFPGRRAFSLGRTAFRRETYASRANQPLRSSAPPLAMRVSESIHCPHARFTPRTDSSLTQALTAQSLQIRAENVVARSAAVWMFQVVSSLCEY